MGFNQGIFPTSVYGQLSDSYGEPTYTNALNPFSNNTSTGLILGQGWLLFDFTIVNLLQSASSSIPANAACTFQAGNSNFYYVIVGQSVTNPGTMPIMAINDRGGALSAVGGINWMTTRGLASALVAASQTASSNTGGMNMAISAAAPGYLTASTPGVSVFANAWLLNNTSAAGVYPIFLR